MAKKVHIIINPASGQDTPILTYINRTLGKSIDWDISVSKKPGQATDLTKKALKAKSDLIAVYGGDGTIMEVAHALYKKQTPLAIIPGGTANIMAKELGIPLNPLEALALLKSTHTKIKKVDMGTLNKIPFLIRVNCGITADMVTQTPRKLKKTFGQAAYSITTIKNLSQVEQSKYNLIIDGKKIVTEGVSLVIANSANIGFSGFSMIPNCDVSDGKLDVIVLKNTDMASLIDLAASAVTQTKPEKATEHWKGKKIKVEITPPQTILCDDKHMKINNLTINITHKAINILVPKT